MIYIKVKLTLDYVIEDFINRKYFGVNGDAIKYLHKVGHKVVPDIKLELSYTYEKDENNNVLLKGVNYQFVNHSELNDLSCFDVTLLRDLYTYFNKQGYPFDSQDINTEETILQFINAISNDGIEKEKYFNIVF